MDCISQTRVNVDMFPQWLKVGLFFAGYVVLMKWILPALGIRTCMSGACRVPDTPGPDADKTIHGK